MHIRHLLLLACLALVAFPASAGVLYDDQTWHTPPNAPGYPPATFDCNTSTFQCTHVEASFYVGLATPVWWDHASVEGVPVPTPSEETQTFEIRNTAPVLVTAETFPINTPDTPKVCLPVRTPDVIPPVAGTVVVHGIQCTKENGYSVQVHYFSWSTNPADPDGVPSITPQQPLATTNWRVDLVPTSYKEAILPVEAQPHGWQVWIDPGVSAGAYDIVFSVQPLDGHTPFWFDYLGTRGCPFYEYPAPGVGDQALLDCPNGYLP